MTDRSAYSENLFAATEAPTPLPQIKSPIRLPLDKPPRRGIIRVISRLGVVGPHVRTVVIEFLQELDEIRLQNKSTVIGAMTIFMSSAPAARVA
jgi:hypothetical protein